MRGKAYAPSINVDMTPISQTTKQGGGGDSSDSPAIANTGTLPSLAGNQYLSKDLRTVVSIKRHAQDVGAVYHLYCTALCCTVET